MLSVGVKVHDFFLSPFKYANNTGQNSFNIFGQIKSHTESHLLSYVQFSPHREMNVFCVFLFAIIMLNAKQNIDFLTYYIFLTHSYLAIRYSIIF